MNFRHQYTLSVVTLRNYEPIRLTLFYFLLSSQASYSWYHFRIYCILSFFCQYLHLLQGLSLSPIFYFWTIYCFFARPLRFLFGFSVSTIFIIILYYILYILYYNCCFQILLIIGIYFFLHDFPVFLSFLIWIYLQEFNSSSKCKKPLTSGAPHFQEGK